MYCTLAFGPCPATPPPPLHFPFFPFSLYPGQVSFLLPHFHFSPIPCVHFHFAGALTLERMRRQQSLQLSAKCLAKIKNSVIRIGQIIMMIMSESVLFWRMNLIKLTNFLNQQQPAISLWETMMKCWAQRTWYKCAAFSVHSDGHKNFVGIPKIACTLRPH